MSLKIECPVSAETIYNHLGIKTPLKAWFKSKCKQLGLKEGEDYEGYKLTPLAYTQLIGQGLLKSEFKSEALAEISGTISSTESGA